MWRFAILLAACGRLGFEPLIAISDAPMDAASASSSHTITAGTRFGCALTTQASCWGRNDFGQLGDGSMAPHGQAMPIANVPSPRAISGSDEGGDEGPGAASACAIDGSGTVWCWGRNDRGQVGDGSGQTQLSPVELSIHDAIDLSVGYRHACAVRATGAVTCWGSNSDGQIAAGQPLSLPTPIDLAGLTDAVEVGAGFAHTCARFRNGDISCWGDNSDGQLGDGTLVTRAPGESRLAGPYVSLAVGEQHVCAVRSNGTVECWGNDDVAQLGNGALSNQRTPGPVDTISAAIQVSAAHVNTCAIEQGGTLSCWGNNELGECGDGVIGGLRRSPTRVTVASDFVEVSVGFHTACARRAGGDVLCWGLNEDGQLGDGTLQTTATPQLVTLP